MSPLISPGKGTPGGRGGLQQVACDNIFRMRSMSKAVVVLLMLMALPMRGYTAVAAGLCDMSSGAAQAIQASAHDHSPAEALVAHDDATDSPGAASVCSACAGCCVGPSQAPSAARPMPSGPIGADRIPFFGKQLPVHVPDRLDRPPLAS